jgi:hypothetical protein
MERKKKIIKWAGAVKVMQQRLSSYVSLVNFLLLFYLFIIENPFGYDWYYWAVFLLFVNLSLVIIDTKLIMPSAFHYTFVKNPGLVELDNQVKENSKKLDKIMEEIGLEK